MRHSRLATTLCTALAVGVAAQPRSQSLADRGEIALHQAILDAGSDRLVLFVASHPDDQYLHPAALARFRYGWRVVVVLMTRGEGGQNISGPETGDALARRRSIETQRCAERLGIRVVHLDCPDRGYSRGAEETLQLWGRLRTGNDLARVIRNVRPDLVWTTHHPGEEHGHDLALLEILPDAVRRAASASTVLDSLAPHRVHAVLRSCAPGEAPDLTLAGDGVDLVRGETFRRLAYQALAEHQSQAPHRTLEELFPATVDLHVIPVEDAPTPRAPLSPPDLFTQGDLSQPTWATAQRTLTALIALERADRGEIVRAALAARAALRSLDGADPDRIQRRLEALERVVVHALGLVWAPTTAVPSTRPGAVIPVALTVQNGPVLPIQGLALHGVFAGGVRSVDGGALAPGAATTIPLEVLAPSLLDAADLSQGPAVRLLAEIGLEGTVVPWPVVVPIDVRPPVEMDATQSAVLLARGHPSLRVAVRLRNNDSTDRAGLLLARVPVPMRAVPESVELALPAGSTRIQMFQIDVPSVVGAGVHSLRFHFGDATTEVPVHAVDVAVPPGLRVGLIPGVDDSSRRVLEDLGVDLHILDGDDVATYDLDTLHTVLVDIRAFRVQGTARAAFDRLLEFVRRGGRLVVLYHKDVEFESPGFRGAPYPLQVGRDRVTQEDAPVRVLLPDHPILRAPNPLQPQDWDGWAQERGLYFASTWDERYVELLAMADRGLPEQRGSLLYTRYGDGDYVYCALALFRQLKKLHPGACRLFANLVSSPRQR